MSNKDSLWGQDILPLQQTTVLTANSSSVWNSNPALTALQQTSIQPPSAQNRNGLTGAQRRAIHQRLGVTLQDGKQKHLSGVYK